MRRLSLQRIKQYTAIIHAKLKRNKWRFLLTFRSGFRSCDDSSFVSRLSMLGEYGVDYAREVSSSQYNQIVQLADKILDGEYDVLGCRKTIPSYKWDTDIKTDFKWAAGKFYSDYVIIDLSNQADVKVPWEISRGHQLLVLAQAYRITQDGQYRDEVLRQILSWIDSNPLMRSINWTCSMEVAIRAVNWMYAIQMIGDAVSGKIAKIIEHSLFDHGFFIINNLENNGRYSANHYMSDIVGLLYLGRLFYDTKEGKRWYEFALQEFYYEIRTQFLPSGFHYERSVSYHRLMVELTTYTLTMLRRVGEVIPVDVVYREKNMLETIISYTKPSGNAPAIGDEDNGRFLPFVPQDFHNHQYLVDLAIIRKGKLEQEKPLVVWEDAGMAVIKEGDFYLFFNNAGLSAYPTPERLCGSHTHCDLLSFELASKQGDIIIDPGTYTYTSDAIKRNEYRSTQKHNTIMVDNIEQYEFDNGNLFRVKNTSSPGLIKGCVDGDVIMLNGCYTRKVNDNTLAHNRSMRYFCNNLVIQDYVEFKGQHTLNMFFHLAPECVVENKDGLMKIEKNDCVYTIDFEHNQKKEGETIHVIEDTISPSYGVEIKSKTIKVSLRFIDNCSIKTKINISA